MEQHHRRRNDLTSRDALPIKELQLPCQYRAQGKFSADGSGALHGTVTVDVNKRYNWGDSAGRKHRGDLGQKVHGHIIGLKLVQNEMTHLNTVGMAHDFDVMGRAAFSVG